MKQRIKIFKDRKEDRKVFEKRVNRWIKKKEKRDHIKIRDVQITSTAFRAGYGANRKDTILIRYTAS